MENIIRIEKIEINGIKNVCHGVVTFNEYNHIVKGDISYRNSVLCICGQNGLGKTTVIEVTKLLRDILVGNKIRKDFNHLICNECDKAEIAYTFYMQTKIKQLITYRFCIELIDNVYQITHEKIISKEYDSENKKWKPQITFIECCNQEITLKKLSNKLSHETLIELRVAQDIEKEHRLSLINEI